MENDIFSLPPKTELHNADNLIECYNLNKEYRLEKRKDPVVALKSINLNTASEYYPVKKGEFLIIRGPSGGGKTTLLNLIGTIDSPTKGEIKIMGKTINAKSTDSFLSQLRLEHIGFVFQTFNLLATMTAFENVELPISLKNKLKEKERRIRVKELLTCVGLQDRMDHLPSELSGGEQQRVAIARAMANEPEVLLLDEPTGDLDSRNTIEVMNLLLRLNRYGPHGNSKECTTCIMVTHNPDLECYGDRILYVQDGVFVKQALNETQYALKPDDYVAYLKQSTK